MSATRRMKPVLEKIRAANPSLADELAPDLLREVRVSPTLVKYANANLYEIETRRELAQAAAELMKARPSLNKHIPVVCSTTTRSTSNLLLRCSTPIATIPTNSSGSRRRAQRIPPCRDSSNSA